MKKAKFIKLCDQIMRHSFYAVVYFIPISIALVESFAGLALLSFFVKRGFIFVDQIKNSVIEKKKRLASYAKMFLKAFTPTPSPLSRPIGFFILISFISIIFSQYPWESIRGFFFKVLQGTFIYFTFIECVRTRKHLKIFIAFFFISFTVVSINGLVQYFTGKGFIFGHPFEAGRIHSSFRHSNDFAAYLLVVAPLLFTLSLINFSKRVRVNKDFILGSLIPVLFLLSTICLGLTLSRGAWIAFILSLIFIGVLNRRILVALILVVAIFLVSFSPKMLESRNTFLFSKMIFQSGSGRINYWKEAFLIIKDHPVLGAGLNTYSLVAPKYKISWGGYAHNSYLQMAAEIGLVGLGIFLWILIRLFRSSIRNLKRMRDVPLKYTLLGLLAGMIGFFIHSCVDTQFYSVQLGNFLWLMMGLIVAVQQIVEEEKTKEAVQ